MKLNEIDLDDPGAILSAIELLMDQYEKGYGRTDAYIEILRERAIG